MWFQPQCPVFNPQDAHNFLIVWRNVSLSLSKSLFKWQEKCMHHIANTAHPPFFKWQEKCMHHIANTAHPPLVSMRCTSFPKSLQD